MSSALAPDEVDEGSIDDARKLRGGYYTPREIADVLARWAVREPSARVLEPSAGDGVLVASAVARLDSTGCVTAIELSAEEAQKARLRGGDRASVIVGDFFTWYANTLPDAAFDAVIGNPPFIRYQNFPEHHRQAAFETMKREGLKPSRLTNAWVPFVVAATRSLRPGGRLALVLPAELLQVSYAAELREYLVRKYRRIVIVTFRTLLFAGIQQETILLFGVREDSNGARMKWLELDGLADLATIEQRAEVNGVPADLDHATEKWTQYYLSASELGLIRQLEQSAALPKLGATADVDVGVVTGRNEFFVLTPAEANTAGLLTSCLPLVGRSAQIPGIVFGPEDWTAASLSNQKCLLLQIGRTQRSDLPSAALKYVCSGEINGFHEGYKCRIRLPTWWHVPSVWIPDAFMLRQIHEGPRVIENLSGATCTDTIHRVRMHDGFSARSLAAVSVNSLTFAFAEIRGRSYGGGVLELEPSEAEALLIPPLSHAGDARDIDRVMRGPGLVAALDTVDRMTLLEAGVSLNDVLTLRGIWEKLSRRRLARRGPSSR